MIDCKKDIIEAALVKRPALDDLLEITADISPLIVDRGMPRDDVALVLGFNVRNDERSELSVT